MVEARALMFGINLAISKHVKYLGIQGDSSNIISALKKFEVPNWNIDYIIQEVRNALFFFESYYIGHCYKEANQLADLLANRGRDSNVDGKIMSSIEVQEDKKPSMQMKVDVGL
ncbi:hypothetical protein SUGI_0140130 [Cryptomeria japonica]|nr:hypothetical protein SUGI_0140130 [Cryptomeria japonica]